MALFYYYDQNPSGFSFLVQIIALCYLNLAGITKFKCERKNEINSGRSSKKTPSCKWLIRVHKYCTKYETFRFALPAWNLFSQEN